MRRKIGALAFASIAGCASFGTADGSGSAAGPDGGSGDGGTCVSACPAGASGCTSYDFSAATCPSDWEPKGDIGTATVVYECTGGRLHVAAQNSLDVAATDYLSPPQVAYRLHLSARIAVRTWDGTSVFALQHSDRSLFELRAVIGATTTPAYSLCDATGQCSATFTTKAASEEHVFAFDVSSTGDVVATIDCQSFARLKVSALPLASDGSLSIVFGSAPATAEVDGTLDDAVVQFLPP